MNVESVSPFKLKLPSIPLMWAFLLLVVIILYELLFIIALNAGTFVYTLDDAYIHLSLSENIAHGYYGINLNENSSPSSSILWPFLLVPFTFFSFHQLIPLLINVAASFATLFYLSKIFELLFAELDDAPKNILLAVLLCILIPGSNLVGLIFTGMEHSLQVLVVVFFFYGMMNEQRGVYSSLFFIITLVLLPLVRYENLSIAIAGIIYLFFRGYKRDAIISLFAIGILLGGFSLFLVSLGLSPVPASVLVKTNNFFSDQNTLIRFFNNASTIRGTLFVIPMLIFALLSVHRDASKGERLFTACASGAIALHLAFGQIGWYSRYEIYMWIFTLLTLLSVFRESIMKIFSSSKIIFISVVVIADIIIGGQYNSIIVTTPYASNNIYEQHYHLRKFIVDFYKKPVAVNDIGYVSYKNDHYILDLVGLASIEAQHLRAEQKGSVEWMNTLAKKNNVSLAIIYDSWFPQRPEGWKKIAEISLSRARITPDSPIVSFYAMNEETFRDVFVQLEEFEKILPFRNMMKFYPLQ